jgi:Fic family protein
MDKQLTQNRPGETVAIDGGGRAFVPAPLPGNFKWTNALVLATTAAEAGLAKLSGLGARFPHPERLLRMFLRREAEFSSRIERTYAGVRTLLLFDLAENTETETPSVREVDNNYRLLQFAFEQPASTPFTLAMLRHMHRILFDRVERPPRIVGEFRQTQNWIGSSNDIREARYVPPPPHRVKECVSELLRFMNSPRDLPPLVRTAMAHYQFEAIHPFDDGNGRVGRGLVIAQLTREADLPVPLLNPSAQLERRRRDYYDLLLDVTEHGAWEPWIEFFCRCVEEESKRSIRVLEQLEQLRAAYHERIRTARTSALLAKIVDYLFGDPALTAKKVSSMLRITPPSAQRAVDRLVEKEILTEVTGQQRNRIFMAEPIVSLFASPSDREGTQHESE